MKERPIIFNGPMVRAILDGKKTQTRRIIKPQPSPEKWNQITAELYHPTKIDRRGNEYPGDRVFGFADEDEGWICPFGQPGDRLWVRETYFCDTEGNQSRCIYRADEISNAIACPGCWRPSIHMPRWASRITLEITGVRVERVQDISEEDSVSEGFVSHPTNAKKGLYHWGARDTFKMSWDSIYNKRGFGWDVNPWVWVTEFKRIEDES